LENALIIPQPAVRADPTMRIDKKMDDLEVTYVMRIAATIFLLVSLFMASTCSEMNSSGESPTVQDSANCVCKISQLRYTEAYITKLTCNPGDCPGFEGIYTYETGGPEYAWNIPGELEAQSPLRIYLFDVTKRSTYANYTVYLKNVGDSELRSVSLVVTLPKGLVISSSTQPFLQPEDKSKATWNLLTPLKSTESKEIQFGTNLPGGKVLANLTAEASGVGEDNRIFNSKWNEGVYEVKDEAQWIVSNAGYEVITGE
jgi:hypothetical protein